MAVATTVRKDEVVPEVNRIPRPSDKVIDMDGLGPERLRAIEALASVEIQQHRTDRGETGTLAAEQELIEIRDLADQIQILLADVTRPSSVDEVQDVLSAERLY